MIKLIKPYNQYELKSLMGVFLFQTIESVPAIRRMETVDENFQHNVGLGLSIYLGPCAWFVHAIYIHLENHSG